MDYKIFLATFVTIFLAEMGDKTQFAALAMSSENNSFWSVLWGVVLALSLAGIIGVVAGRFVGSFLSPEMTRYVSGSLFLVIGFWTLFFK